MKNNYLPLNLQLFAEGEGGNGGEGGNSNQNNAGATGTNNNNIGGTSNTTGSASTTGASIDYDKIQQMLDTATTKKENAVLKSYFQQQGLSEDEAKQAIATFKEAKQQQSAQQQEDTSELQSKIAEAQKEATKAKVELEATKVAMTLGIDDKSLPYVLKMADLSNAMDKDGKISAENVKAALNQVLTDVPALKGQQEASKGFQIGAGQSSAGNATANNTQNQTVQKRWNRFN